MEFIVPVGDVRLGERVITDTKLSLSEKYLLIIGTGRDGMYEERILGLDEELTKLLLIEKLNYLRNLLDELDALIIDLGRELGVELGLREPSQEEPVNYLISRLRLHDGYLNTVGNGWRRILDSAGIGKARLTLTAPTLYITHVGNNITLNLVLEPVENPVVDVSTYTEGKVVGNVRVRVGEDVVAKMDVRSLSSLIIISQTREGSMIIGDVASRVSVHVKSRVRRIIDIMRKEIQSPHT